MTVQGIQGTYFSVWAPNALRVSVGDFNYWDGSIHCMRIKVNQVSGNSSYLVSDKAHYTNSN